MTRDRALQGLLRFAMLGDAHWFFGNLYEVVAIAPNITASPTEALGHWRGLFRVRNPIHYYIPFSPLTIAATLGAAAIGWRGPADRRRWLAGAAVASSCGGLITYWFVTRLNVNLFFSELAPAEAASVYRARSRRAGFMGVARLACVAAAFYCTLRSAR